MDDFLSTVQKLIADEEIKISEHGYDELAEDDLSVTELINGVDGAVIVEEYPDYPKGPCILVLQEDQTGAPVHVVWGIPAGYSAPAVLVTAYRPDPERWDDEYRRRSD
jgi:hypothetical protein